MVAIDVLGIGDIRGDAMTRTVGAPLVLLWAFGEGGPIELLQWTCLGACLVLLLRVVRRPTSARGTGYRRVMILGWIGIAFMFLEDTLNTRHVFVQSVLPIIVGHVDERSALAIATELSLYWAMGGVMLAFLILGYRSFRAAPPASSYLVAGYVAYGLAAAASATRHLGGWYRRLGDGLIERIAPSAVELYQDWAPAPARLRLHVGRPHGDQPPPGRGRAPPARRGRVGAVRQRPDHRVLPRPGRERLLPRVPGRRRGPRWLRPPRGQALLAGVSPRRRQRHIGPIIPMLRRRVFRRGGWMIPQGCRPRCNCRSSCMKAVSEPKPVTWAMLTLIRAKWRGASRRDHARTSIGLAREAQWFTSSQLREQDQRTFVVG
jgi:hypothetical protein